MNGRFFDGRQIEANLYAGRQRFKRSGAGDDTEEGDDADKKRLDDFAQWLMTEGDWFDEVAIFSVSLLWFVKQKQTKTLRILNCL